MELGELIDKDWKNYERKRFIKDSTKSKTDSFDPEQFKHDGFDDRERYLETYVPALADEERLNHELNNFTPPRVSSINDSPYQALVIRYGILRILIQQLDYRMGKEALLEAVQAWQQQLIEEYTEDDFGHDDDLLHLAKAGVNYGSDIDDSELHMVYSYFELHNRAQERKDEFYTWLYDESGEVYGLNSVYVLYLIEEMEPYYQLGFSTATSHSSSSDVSLRATGVTTSGINGII